VSAFMQPRDSAVTTVLFNDRLVELERIPPDAKDTADALWIHASDLPRLNGFELKANGACRGDLCIPIPADIIRGDAVNVTAFAARAGQSVVAEPDAQVWSFGEMPALTAGLAHARIAPDFTVPDRLGRPVHLAGFRGKKALVMTWASW
jgi:hypothetical protein